MNLYLVNLVVWLALNVSVTDDKKKNVLCTIMRLLNYDASHRCSLTVTTRKRGTRTKIENC